jgi:uncharacterized heparinase superfamily protein
MRRILANANRDSSMEMGPPGPDVEALAAASAFTLPFEISCGRQRARRNFLDRFRAPTNMRSNASLAS